MNKKELLTRQKLIRNFSIIAHIDHGKSTLADRILEMTNTVQKRDMQEQLLDTMDLERERGITIKLNAVELNYKAKDGKDYIFHLIDTPGHVDFAYEVSRSLAACEGALLVVDASQGIEAQTLANVYLALDNDLEILPILNKVDLASANPDKVVKEIEDIIGLPATDAPRISAKTGLNVDEVLEMIVKSIPAPTGDINGELKALVFDSYYDKYRGVIPLISVKQGILRVGDTIKMMATGAEFLVTSLGVHSPSEVKKDYLMAGDVGFVVAQIKSIKDIHVGDTMTLASHPASTELPGYKRLLPMVYCGLYPTDPAKYEELKEALEKLQLNDASLVFEPESSQALGFGFRAGFLGLLHMDVVQERIDREFNVDMIATAPSVIYKVNLTNSKSIKIDNPSQMPEVKNISSIEEPYVKCSVFTPNDYVGSIMKLCQGKRGIYKNTTYIDENRVDVEYEMPLSEIIYDFFDKLKSQTKGYASFDYELIGYRKSDLVKMDILLNGNVVDALSIIVHRDFAYNRGHQLTVKLKEVIPRQQFEVPVQAAIGTKIISRTNIKALQKNVLAKCYGGDVSRKKKLLNKQKEGKKRMKKVGSVEVPQEAFMAILNVDDE